jgi:cell division protein FtsZ
MEVEASPSHELMPVPASVFDDDFFRSSAHGVEIGELGDADSAGDALPERFREPTHFSAHGRVQQEDGRSVAAEVANSSTRVQSYGGAVAAPDHEPDELDIPAFLRRGN